MEIELKYLLNNKEQADEIMNSEFVSAITIPGTERTLDMDALYFDTEDLDLSAERISYRIRLEGDAYVATVKEKGQVDAGMHRRVEVNVDLPEGAPMPSLVPGSNKDEAVSALMALGFSKSEAMASLAGVTDEGLTTQ